MKRSISAKGVSFALLFSTLIAPALAEQREAANHSLKPAATRAKEIHDYWTANNPAAPTVVVNPVLTGGDITTPVIEIGDLPAAPGIAFSFQTGPAGLAYAYFHFKTPLGQELSYPWYDPSAPISGTQHIVPIQYQWLNAWAPSGLYRLTAVDLIDAVGNIVTFGESQVDALFRNKSFRVVNRNADNLLPVLFTGTIRTPSISLSSQRPVLQVDLKVEDRISGVGSAEIDFLGPDGQTASFGGGRAPAPILRRSDTLSIGTNFTYETFFPIGTWTITKLAVWNYAGTKLEITEPALIQSILGVTTFQLTP